MKLSTVFAVITTLTAWFALGLQQYILIDNTPENGLTPLQAIGRFLIFFTVLSNLFVALCLTATIVSPSSRMGRFFSTISTQTAVAVYIFIVGLVYNLVLRQLWQPEGWQRVADELLHVVVPVLFIVYWLLFVPKGSLTFKQSLPWLTFPAVYLVYAMTRAAIDGYYAYPFLNVKQLGYGRVALNCGGLLLAFLVAGIIAVAIDKWLGPAKK